MNGDSSSNTSSNTVTINGDSLHADTDSVPSVEAMDTQESNRPASPALTDTVWGAPATGGWGYRDGSGWGRWEATPVTDQNRERHLSHSTALRNLRIDFNNANLSFSDRHNRDTALDDVDTKLWASIQCYRSSEEGRRGSSLYPTFTGCQVVERLEEVKVQLSSRIHEQEALSKQVQEASSALAALQRREKDGMRDIESLRNTKRELEYLKEIAYARLM
ncbi:hypothetical protein EV361DRAFT_956019 [Lentinula raphanica]|uniref:Uncharacterized protein n=1 Tax=Lentinula raphanica TaxID=153919 RepID=A0AA38NWL2_9AGAR|nr:hypothetical protein F5878DRAFT_647307 [Lentinula raphanica]KAJ3964363.1 hypothetical protein EV361DRAFT_956019 [Lentinula raphanica]